MTPVLFHPEAEAELDQSIGFYEERQQGLDWISKKKCFRESLKFTILLHCGRSTNMALASFSLAAFLFTYIILSFRIAYGALRLLIVHVNRTIGKTDSSTLHKINKLVDNFAWHECPPGPPVKALIKKRKRVRRPVGVKNLTHKFSKTSLANKF